jgi:hypothetical protein
MLEELRCCRSDCLKDEEEKLEENLNEEGELFDINKVKLGLL